MVARADVQAERANRDTGATEPPGRAAAGVGRLSGVLTTTVAIAGGLSEVDNGRWALKSFAIPRQRTQGKADF